MTKITHIQKNIDTLFDFSDIRIQKILELFQYCLLFIIVGTFLGLLVEKIFPKDDIKTVKKKKTSQLLIINFIELFVYVITIFYIGKIAKIVPFLFQYTNNYSPGSHGENRIGGTIGLILVIQRSVPSFIIRIEELINRIRKQFYS
jgi:hypothetical protein